LFLQGVQSAQGAMLVYPRDGWGNTAWCLVFTCCLLNVSQGGLESASGSAGALLFSQCNVASRSFVQAKGSGCLISAKYVSSVSARFFIYRAHAVCFCTLPSWILLARSLTILWSSPGTNF
jgi:hypothetical protein